MLHCINEYKLFLISASPGPVTCEAENSEGIITTTEHIPEPG